MKQNFIRLLVITDHSKHEAYESLYPLLRSMKQHPACAQIVVISRVHAANADFFAGKEQPHVFGIEVDDSFDVETSREALLSSSAAYPLKDFHQYILRLPKPNPEPWFLWLEELLGGEKIINKPSGILKTGSKAYLTNFRDLCPPLRVCSELIDVDSFRRQFPIVLKPLKDAGGRGLVKIDGDQVWIGNTQLSWEAFLPDLTERLKDKLLAMEYLSRVDHGDKRVLVANGQIVGCSLRMPAADSWLCNVNMGGSAITSQPTEEEQHIARIISADLQKEGVILFGFDTLEDSKGLRVLSEINASCAGGFYPAEQLSGEPVIARTAQLLWQYILEKQQEIFT